MVVCVYMMLVGVLRPYLACCKVVVIIFHFSCLLCAVYREKEENENKSLFEAEILGEIEITAATS